MPRHGAVPADNLTIEVNLHLQQDLTFWCIASSWEKKVKMRKMVSGKPA